MAIELLRKTFGRVLYIDLDVHHGNFFFIYFNFNNKMFYCIIYLGNGVEYAYMATDRVLTLSFHQYEPGFYPTSGSLDDIGIDKGKYYTVNVPLKEGMTDEKYTSLFYK